MDDAAYHAARAQAELRLAAQATLAHVRDIHLDLARLHGADPEQLFPDAAVRLKRVLVVDADTLVRRIAAAMLGGVAGEIVEAADATEAWDRLEACSAVDAAVIDAALPGVDGVQLAAVMAEQHPSTALVLVSARPGLHEGELPQHVAFLRKPYRSAELIDAIEQALGKRVLGRERSLPV